MASKDTTSHAEKEKAASLMDGMSLAATTIAASVGPQTKRDNGDDRNDRQDAGRLDESSPKPKKRRKAPQVQDVSELEPAPYPFFCYCDHSRDTDIDRLALLEEGDHVPSFPVKMHAILSDPALKSIISWDTHGRSFKILRPRDFEAKVLPRFFEHASMASFQRQVNGWGFRRLTEGDNRNSYYEEHFLRSLPWLCKKMRRPKVGEKKKSPVQYEPDLVAISEIFPLPTTSTTREIDIVLEVIKKGPKAKIPANWLADEPRDLTQAQSESDLTANNKDSKPAALHNPALSVPDIRARHPLVTVSAPPSTMSSPQALLSLLQQNEYSNSLQHAFQQTSLAGSLNSIVGFARSNENQLIVGMPAAAQSQSNDRISNNLLNSLVSNCVAAPPSGNSLLVSLVASQSQNHAMRITQGHGDVGHLANGNNAMPAIENSLALAMMCVAIQNQAIPNVNAATPLTPNQLIMSLRLQEMVNRVNLSGAGGMEISAIERQFNPNPSNIGRIEEGIRGNFSHAISMSDENSTLDLNNLNSDQIEILNRWLHRQY